MRLPAIVLSCLVAAALPATLWAKEKTIKRSQVPGPVIAAFEKAYPKATMKGFTEEQENGKTFYEIESIAGSTSRDILYSADGAVVEMEEGLKLNELPDVVVNAVKATYPGGVIKSAEKLTKGETTLFEVAVVVGKKKIEVQVDPQGTIIPANKPSTS
jgi:hypothetical protein